MILIGSSGQVSWIDVPRVALAILAGALVFTASGIVFFSLAFWLGNVDSLGRQLWELLITFSLYPEPLFGGALRLALFTVLPAGFVGYLPARIVQAPSLADVGAPDDGRVRTGAGRAGVRSRPAPLRLGQRFECVRLMPRLRSADPRLYSRAGTT